MESLTDDETAFIGRKKGRDGKERTLVVVIVVDDCMMAEDNDEEGEELRQEWLKHMRGFFSISDDGELK
eukprot:211261-Rhodomonas_salina.1